MCTVAYEVREDHTLLRRAEMSPTIKCHPVWEEVLHVGVCASALLHGEVEHLLREG